MVDENLSVVNLVASGELGVGELDTGQLAKDIAASEIIHQPGRIYLKSENYPTINIYKSGKFSIAGADSQEDVSMAIHWLTQLLNDLDIRVSEDFIQETTSVEFMVFQGDFEQKIDLASLVEELDAGIIEYEPEQFPAIIYEPYEMDCTITIFSTGKVSITGIREVGAAKKIFNDMKDTLQDIVYD